MNNKKRLTYRDTEYNDPMYNRLQELENKIEDGLLLELRKLGSTVEEFNKEYRKQAATCKGKKSNDKR